MPHTVGALRPAFPAGTRDIAVIWRPLADTGTVETNAAVTDERLLLEHSPAK
jgi:hypothetical protein